MDKVGILRILPSFAVRYRRSVVLLDSVPLGAENCRIKCGIARACDVPVLSCADFTLGGGPAVFAPFIVLRRFFVCP